MNEALFKKRTRQVALRIIRVVESLPQTNAADVIGRQALRSGTSIGANYRAACRGRSAADMIAKLGIVEEETDETLYWLDLIIESKLMTPTKLAPLQAELTEILAMVVASIKTLRARARRSPNPKSKI